MHNDDQDITKNRGFTSSKYVAMPFWLKDS